VVVYVICVDQESGKYCAFSKDDHAQRVTAHSQDSAVAQWVGRYAKGIVDIKCIDHEMPPDPPPQAMEVPVTTNLTWSQALQAMQQGKHVARMGWAERALSIQPESLPHITAKTTKASGIWDLKDSKQHTDAKDWQIVDWPPKKEAVG
jgi:hypothetical protein